MHSCHPLPTVLHPSPLALIPGHVFHQPCLLGWFSAQAKQYVAAQRDLGDDEVEESDAPAECPTCRTECYADPEGRPEIYRLYVNFGQDAQSQLRSSPLRPTQARASQRYSENDAIGLAKRAKSLGQAIRQMDADTPTQEVEGAVMRAENIKTEVLSDKALGVLKVGHRSSTWPARRAHSRHTLAVSTPLSTRSALPSRRIL